MQRVPLTSLDEFRECPRGSYEALLQLPLNHGVCVAESGASAELA